MTAHQAHFPQTLKSWRKAKRFSQLDLAVEADVSSRHISFLETGRAKPSRDMVSRLGAALQLPLAARNQMLAHAGFAPRYATRAWDHPDMEPIRAAVDHTLGRHAPYPALAIDRLWSVLALNGPAQSLFGGLGVREGSSLLDLMMGDVLPDLIENWPQVAYHGAQRLRTESAAQGGVPELDKAAAFLCAVAGDAEPSPLPVVPTLFNANGVRLRMFTTLAQFGTPDDLTLDDLKMELYFPADATTKTALEQMAAAANP